MLFFKKLRTKIVWLYNYCMQVSKEKHQKVLTDTFIMLTLLLVHQFLAKIAHIHAEWMSLRYDYCSYHIRFGKRFLRKQVILAKADCETKWMHILDLLPKAFNTSRFNKVKVCILKSTYSTLNLFMINIGLINN